MSFLQNVLRVMKTGMTTPTPYGWFHILWLVITLGICLYLSVFRRQDAPERIRRVVLLTALIVSVLEIYKQIVFSFSDSGFDYQWYIFPFQFSSEAMNALLTSVSLSKKS